MLLLCGPRTRFLVTSQREDLRLNCKLAKVRMGDVGPEKARRILASHIGLKDQSIPEATQGLADDIIHKIGRNPLAISCMAQAIDPQQAAESREWEKALEDLSDWLDSSEASQIHSTQYGGSFWGALHIAFEKLTKQEKNLLVLVSMCEGPSVPEEVLEFLYERGNSSNKFQASRRHLETRQLIAIAINEEQQQKSWSIHSLLDRFINEKKKGDKTEMFKIFCGLTRSESAALSQEAVHIRDEYIVNVLGVLYFNSEYAEKLATNMSPSLGKSSHVRRNVIEPITRLLVFKENSDSEWTPHLIDCTRQVFMKYIAEGVLHESGVLTLLRSPTSAISVLQALNGITIKDSSEYGSVLFIEKMINALFKILSNLFKTSKKEVYATKKGPRLISHIAKLLPTVLLPRYYQYSRLVEGNSNLQHHFSTISERNSKEFEVVVSSLTDDKGFQAEAATVLYSIAQTHPMVVFAMFSFPGFSQGLQNVIKFMSDKENFEYQLEVLILIGSVVSGSSLMCHDIRVSIGSLAFSCMLKVLVNICCDNKPRRDQLTLKGYALQAVMYISFSAFRCEDAESIRIIHSVEGLVEGLITLLGTAGPKFPFERHVVGTIALVAPAMAKQLLLNSDSGFFGRAHALATLGHYEDSLKDLDSVKDPCDQDLNFFGVCNLRLFVKTKLGDQQGALADADLWISMAPKDSISFQERGVLKHMIGDLDGAVRDLDFSLKLFQDDYDVLKHRGYAKFLRNDDEGAWADAERALSVKPSYVDRPGYKNALHLGASSVRFLHFQLR